MYPKNMRRFNQMCRFAFQLKLLNFFFLLMEDLELLRIFLGLKIGSDGLLHYATLGDENSIDVASFSFKKKEKKKKESEKKPENSARIDVKEDTESHDEKQIFPNNSWTKIIFKST